jgi:hypothetical protein
MPDPSTAPLRYDGLPVDSSRVIELWTGAEQRFAGVDGRTDRIQKAQQFRRGTYRVALNGTFLTEHPEIDPQSAVSILPEREGYERDLITKAGAVEPTISREPLDVTDTAQDDAEQYESYMRDVAADEESGVPFQTFIEKFTEDGEGGVVVLPWDLDAEGLPDFYDKLTERALAQQDEDTRKQYSKDQNDRRGRYVRRDAKGNRVYNAAYTRDQHGRTQAAAEKKDGKGTFKRDHGQSEKAHDAAVRRYLLQHSASTFRFIPALDCYPLLGRGTGRQRWSVDGLIERAAFTREMLVEKKYGWAQLGNRLLVPKGVRRSYQGTATALYLYTAYLVCRDDDMIERPCIFYTVGGASTWWDGMPDDLKGDRNQVAMIDLYAERKLRGRRWHYDFGLHTADDDPNWYGRPAIWPVMRPILNIEHSETAGNVTTALNAYTGHYYKPDPKFLEADPEAVVEASTHTFRKPRKPGPGQVEPWGGDVIPFVQAQIGPDHWRTLAEKRQVLTEALAIDTIRGDTGNAMLVSSSQGQTSKRHIKEAALRMFKFCLEKDAENRLAAYKCHEVKWPILSSRERPVGHEVRSRYEAIEFNPDWLGEDENPKLNVDYGEEYNLAKVDAEINAYLKGTGTLKRVAAALGEDDLQNFIVEIQKDRRRNSPQYQQYLDALVDSLRQNKLKQQVTGLQAGGELTQHGVPGAPNGIPTAILNRMQQGGGQQPAAPGGTLTGGPSVGASARGGIDAGAQQAAAAQTMAQTGGPGGVAAA